MNERIKLLAEQCRIETYGVNGELLAADFDEQKFAELIVFECVNAAMDGTKEGDHYAQRIDNRFNDSPAGILHFGVEE